jgi:hypothetical protein
MRREPKEELVKKCQSIPGGSDTSEPPLTFAIIDVRTFVPFRVFA